MSKRAVALIVTGWTGLFGQRGEALEHSAIESLIGAVLFAGWNHAIITFASRLSLENPRNPRNPWQSRARLAIPGRGTGRRLRADERDADRRPAGAASHRPSASRQGGDRLADDAAGRVGPAVLLNTLGKGRVLTFAGSPDVATAGEHRIVEARKLLANAVRAGQPHPRLQFEAPAFVEVVATDDPDSKQYHVHLIAYTPVPTATPPKNRPYVLPGLIEDPPMYRRESIWSADPGK